jgi:hypothetical protein
MTLPIVKGSVNFCGNFDRPEIMCENFALNFAFLGAIYKGIVVLIFFVTLRLRTITLRALP